MFRKDFEEPGDGSRQDMEQTALPEPENTE